MHLQFLGDQEQAATVAVGQSRILLFKLELVHGPGGTGHRVLGLALQLFVVSDDALHLLHLLILLKLVDTLQIA